MSGRLEFLKFHCADLRYSRTSAQVIQRAKRAGRRHLQPFSSSFWQLLRMDSAQRLSTHSFASSTRQCGYASRSLARSSFSMDLRSTVNPTFKSYIEGSATLTAWHPFQQPQPQQRNFGPRQSTPVPHRPMSRLKPTSRPANSSRVFPGHVDLDKDGEFSSGRVYLYDITGGHGSQSSMNYELMYSGWNTDLPDPRLFICESLSRHFVFRPLTFLSQQ